MSIKAAAKGFRSAKAAGYRSDEQGGITHLQHAVEVQCRKGHRCRRSFSSDPMLPVTFDLHVVQPNREAALGGLSFKPGEALLPHNGETMRGTIAIGAGLQRIHDDIMLDRAAAGRIAAPDDWIGAQREAEPIFFGKHRCKRLRFVDVEQRVAVRGHPRGKDQEVAPSFHLAPQEVAVLVRSFGKKRPDQVVSGVLRSLVVAQQQR